MRFPRNEITKKKTLPNQGDLQNRWTHKCLPSNETVVSVSCEKYFKLVEKGSWKLYAREVIIISSEYNPLPASALQKMQVRAGTQE